VINNRINNIWVAWVHEYLLKGRSFWNVSIPNNSSWYWRKLLKIRSLAWGFLRFDVGNGSNIHLWVDNWHPFRALFDRFSFRVIYDSNSRLDAKLDTVLKQGNWCWRPTRSEGLVAIQSRLTDVPIGGIDKPVWNLAKFGVFTCAETWNYLRKKNGAVRWWPLVWHSFAILKQAFILWLALHNRLTTGDRLFAWGFKENVNCGFCKAGIESRNHIFFSCGFSSRVWKICLQQCGLLNCSTSWSEVIDERCITWKSKNLMGTICRLILSSAVYWIWWARNELKVGGQLLTEEQVLKQIFWANRCRISEKGKFPKTMENIILCHKWNIDACILS
jgi:hypothetical protein